MTDHVTADVMQMVLDYRRAVDAAVIALERQAATDNLLVACRSGALPARGRLDQLKGRYTFHGVGCLFEIASRTVEVDFGPDGRHDGFDEWRLRPYAESAFEWRNVTSGRIESGLAELEQAGLVHAPRWEPSPHLLYLAL